MADLRLNLSLSRSMPMKSSDDTVETCAVCGVEDPRCEMGGVSYCQHCLIDRLREDRGEDDGRKEN